MRKLFGLLFFVVAAAFLGMAYSQFARAEGLDCKSALAKKIADLHQADKSDILAMQYELTVLKLAKESMRANTKTVESYIKKQEALIQKLDDQNIRPQLVDLYRKYGALTDDEIIEAQLTKVETEEEKAKAQTYRKTQAEKALQDSVAKIETASYFRASTRFKNRELSAYVRAHAATQEGSGVYGANDVAILWYQAQLSDGVEAKTARGSASANLMEASTRVAQLTGVAGTIGKTPEEIESAIQAKQVEIKQEFDRIAGLYGDELKLSCREMATCATCAVNSEANQLTDENKSGALSKAVQSVVARLQGDTNAREARVEKALAKVKEEQIQRDPVEVAAAEKAVNEKTSKVPFATATADPKKTPDYYPGLSVQGEAKAPLPAKVSKPEEIRLVPKLPAPKPVTYKKTYGNCPAVYSVEPVEGVLYVNFSIISSQGTCAGRYAAPTLMIRGEAAWDPKKVAEACAITKAMAATEQSCGGAAAP